LQSNLFWLDYMLQEKGFIRKAKARWNKDFKWSLGGFYYEIYNRRN
jgi:hypothetical protein